MQKRATFRALREAQECRRERSRTPVQPVYVTAWIDSSPPTRVPTIEADVRGARLMLPWRVERGDTVVVSFATKLGNHQTRTAKIAWSQAIETSGRFVAGMSFDEELSLAV